MFILDWLRIAVSWILVQFESLFSALLVDPDVPVADQQGRVGWSWALAIVGLVVVIRILLIPLFVKQIKAQRNMQLIQPQVKELQKKYAGDKNRQSQELMKLYKETGTNPLSSCLPLLLQMPIFFALFNVLNGIANMTPEGVFNWSQYAVQFQQAHDATIFGVPLYGSFLGADETPSPGATRVLSLILIVAMVSTTFITQRQLMLKNTAADNPMAKQLKLMMYGFPIMFAVIGVNFPIGVLIYWFTTNLWTMGQQFYVIRNNPQPNTPAAEAHERRQAEKAAKKAVRRGEVSSVEEALKPPVAPPTKRQQPKRQSRNKRKAGPGSKPPGSPDETSS